MCRFLSRIAVVDVDVVVGVVVGVVVDSAGERNQFESQCIASSIGIARHWRRHRRNICAFRRRIIVDEALSLEFGRRGWNQRGGDGSHVRRVCCGGERCGNSKLK